MSMVALDRHGQHCAISTILGRTYVYQSSGMAAPAELPRLIVPVTGS